MQFTLYITKDDENIIRIKYVTERNKQEQAPDIPYFTWEKALGFGGLALLSDKIYGEGFFITPDRIKTHDLGDRKRCSYTYTLPKDPLQALFLFSHFIAMLSKHNYEKYYFKSELICEDPLVNWPFSRFAPFWYEEIRALTYACPRYKEVHRVFTLGANYVAKLRRGTVDGVTEFMKLFDQPTLVKSTPEFLAQYFNKGKFTEQFLVYAKKMLSSQKETDKNYVKYLLWANREQTMQSFYQDYCKEKIAADGNKYQRQHTELLLLEEGKFRKDKNNLSIVDIQENPAYQKFYAAGRVNAEIYTREMRHLFHITDLQTIPGCQLHDEITFASFTSKMLVKYGFHLDFEALCQALNNNNTPKLFKPAAITEEKANEEVKEDGEKMGVDVIRGFSPEQMEIDPTESRQEFCL